MGSEDSKPAPEAQPPAEDLAKSQVQNSRLNNNSKLKASKAVANSPTNNQKKENNAQGASLFSKFKEKPEQRKASPEMKFSSLSKQNPNGSQPRAPQIQAEQPRKNQRNHYEQGQDVNQFAPLMKLPVNGELKLKITLTELNLQLSPKPCLRKRTSHYPSSLAWKKSPTNTFAFTLKQDQNYESAMEVDIQGNTLKGDNQHWCVLCPINIPLGKSTKLGNIICVTWHTDLNSDTPDVHAPEPPPPAIDMMPSQQIFDKWQEQIPETFYNPGRYSQMKKLQHSSQQLRFYKELNRYFDMRDMWGASTYVESTGDRFRAWVVEVQGQDVGVGRQLHEDLKAREEAYVRGMYGRLS